MVIAGTDFAEARTMGSHLRRDPPQYFIETASDSRMGNSCNCFDYDGLRSIRGFEGQLSTWEHMKELRARYERWGKKRGSRDKFFFFSRGRTKTCFVEMTEVDSTGIGSGQRRVERIAPCLACLRSLESRAFFAIRGSPQAKRLW